jgi:hypothetical protein
VADDFAACRLPGALQNGNNGASHTWEIVPPAISIKARSWFVKQRPAHGRAGLPIHRLFGTRRAEAAHWAKHIPSDDPVADTFDNEPVIDVVAPPMLAVIC